MGTAESVRGIILHAATARQHHRAHPDWFLVDVHDLASQISALAARTPVLSLDEVLDHLAEGRPGPPGAVHLSIDHGYLGTVEAAELLDRYHLPWTLFVSVDAVLDGRAPWFVRIADAVEVSNNVLDAAGALHDLADAEGKRQFLQRAAAAVRAAPVGGQEDVVAAILALPGMAQPDGTMWPFLAPEHLAELSSAGVTVGSHGVEHFDLTRVAEARAQEAVAASARLERVLGVPVRYFAYPHGRHDRRVRHLVARDHELAVAGPRRGGGDDRFCVGRWDAGGGRAELDRALGNVRTSLPASARAAIARRIRRPDLLVLPDMPTGRAAR